MNTTLTTNNLNLDDIHPSKGVKYSPNLHQFLSDIGNSVIATYGRVYRSADGSLWIGYLFDKSLIGSRLSQVLGYGRKQLVFSFDEGDMTEVKDFWENYIKIGRCAIDPEHTMYFIGDNTRWDGDEEHRSCLWCGEHDQYRKRWTETVNRDAWVSGSGAPQHA